MRTGCAKYVAGHGLIGVAIGLFAFSSAATAGSNQISAEDSDAVELARDAVADVGVKATVSTQSIEGIPTQSAPPFDSASASAAAVGYEAIEEAFDEPAGPLDSVAFSIDQGEFVGTVAFLERYIRAVESAHHRLHPDLVEPLTLLGDAHFGQQRPDWALDAYSRALHVRRVNDGLFVPEQVAVVYRQAEALKATGNLEEAGNREEYAYSVLLKAHGALGEAMLPGTYRLAEWYRESPNIFAARALYERAMRIHEASGKQNTPAALPALDGLVFTYREERFPPYYVDDNRSPSLRAAPMSLTSRSMVFDEPFRINNFPAAERALQQIVQIRREDPQSTQMEVFDAILDLADWHLMWERFSKAHTLYEFVYAEMDGSDGIDAREYFAQPRLLHMPLPADPKPLRQEATESVAESDKVPGFIETSFRVSANGSAQNIAIVAADPEGLMDFRARRSVRNSRHRPAMENGRAIPFENQTWRHEFEYVPREEEVEDA